MTWIDAVIILIFIGLLFLEMVRGFFPALVWFIMEYFVLLITEHSYQNLARSMQWFAGSTNDGFWFGFVFVALSALTFWLSHYLQGVTDVDLGGFDQGIGMFVALGTALVIAHAFTRTLDIGSVNGPVHKAIISSTIANEMLNFTTYHKWVDGILRWSHTAKY
jgi:hypothetical protein